MRVLPILLSVLLLAGFFAFRFSAGTMGMMSTRPGNAYVRFDLDRNAVRQESITVMDTKLGTVIHEITVLGPTNRVLEPWLQLEATFSAMRFVGLPGRTSVTLPGGTRTAIWNARGQGWDFHPEEFADLWDHPPPGIERVDDVTAIPHLLVELQPERSDLVREAFPSAFEEGGQR